MKKIELTPKEIDLKAYRSRSAFEQDAKKLIDFDCLITQGGKPVILYKKLDIDTSELRKAVRSIQYATSTRTNGLKTTSAIFGYRPRVAVRNDYCTATAMATNDKRNHGIIAGFATQLTEYYEKYFPEIFEMHHQVVGQRVKDEWTIPGTPFTSGIVNKNNPLKYHHDKGNFKGVLSNMIVFKRDVRGGHLACPEFDLKFECADNTLVIFNGQNILHGVTPIKYLTKQAYRYSTVYYSLEQMWKCDSVDEELIRIRELKLKRELKRIKKEGENK